MKDKKLRVLVSIITGGGTYWVLQCLLKIYNKEDVFKVSGLVLLAVYLIFIIGVIYLIVTKLYIIALFCTSLLVPMIIMSIGLIYDKLMISTIGMLVVFTAMLIWFILLRKYGSELKELHDKLKR